MTKLDKLEKRIRKSKYDVSQMMIFCDIDDAKFHGELVELLWTLGHASQILNQIKSQVFSEE